MGRFTTPATLENAEDLFRAHRGELGDDQVRRIHVTDALVDTGSASLSLPARMIRELGLTHVTVRRSTTATGYRDVPVYGAVKLTIAERVFVCDVGELADECLVVIGQVPLEITDWVVDPRGQRLIGNPAHGGQQFTSYAVGGKRTCALRAWAISSAS